MADVTPAIRDQVEKIAATNDMPLAPLYGALISADLASLNTEDRINKLTEAAHAFVQTREDLKRLSSSDPQVMELRRQAENSLSMGAFAEARQALAKAIKVDAAAGNALAGNLVLRRLSEAASYVSDAGVARAQLDYSAAITSLEAAAALHKGIEGLEVPDSARRDRNWLLADLGDMQMVVGNSGAALDAYQRMQQAATLRLEAAPNLPDAQRDLSVSQNRIGDVKMAQGDLAGALAAYQASLDIATRLVTQDAGNADWQRDLSVSQKGSATSRWRRATLPGRWPPIRPACDIRTRLAAQDAGNAGWQRDLSVSQKRSAT